MKSWCLLLLQDKILACICAISAHLLFSFVLFCNNYNINCAFCTLLLLLLLLYSLNLNFYVNFALLLLLLIYTAYPAACKQLYTTWRACQITTYPSLSTTIVYSNCRLHYEHDKYSLQFGWLPCYIICGESIAKFTKSLQFVHNLVVFCSYLLLLVAESCVKSLQFVHRMDLTGSNLRARVM